MQPLPKYEAEVSAGLSQAAIQGGPGLSQSMTAEGELRSQGSDDFYDLRLYLAGQTPRSVAALTNLKRFCEEHLEGKYRIEVIDLVQDPKMARSDQIFAIPTLVRRLPEPVRKIIGDLSNRERVVVGLEIRPRG